MDACARTQGASLAGMAEEVGIAAWRAVLLAHSAAVRAIERDVQRHGQVSLSWYDVLLELRHSDGGLRMQDLSERVVLSRTRVSRLVEEMVRAGLVRRRPDPDDGRVSWAVITETGRSALRATAPVYLDSIRTHFVARLEDGEAEVLRRALMRVAGRPADEPLPGAAPR